MTYIYFLSVIWNITDNFLTILQIIQISKNRTFLAEYGNTVVFTVLANKITNLRHEIFHYTHEECSYWSRHIFFSSVFFEAVTAITSSVSFIILNIIMLDRIISLNFFSLSQHFVLIGCSCTKRLTVHAYLIVHVSYCFRCILI